MDQRNFYLTKNIPIIRSGDLDHEEVKRVNHNDDNFLHFSILPWVESTSHYKEKKKSAKFIYIQLISINKQKPLNYRIYRK